MAVYNGNEPYIFVSYAHSDSKKVLPIIEYLQQAGVRIWYDDGIEAGSEWPQYIAENLEKASCVLVFMSPNAANSHNCRNEINLASELKKEFLVVHLVDFELALGLRLQLNSNQAIFRSKFKSDDEFMNALATAKILQKYKDDNNEKAIEDRNNTTPVKSKKSLKVFLLAVSSVVVFAICLIVFIGFSKDKNGEAKDDNVSESTTEATTKQEAAIIDYEHFYENLIAVSEKLNCNSLWTPSDLLDNYRLDQGDGDIWVTYYTDSFQLKDVSLHLAFRNEDAEIMAVLNSFREGDLDTAYKILECISSAVNGNYFTDFNELMVNEDRDPWRALEEPHSIWNETLGLEESVFLRSDKDIEIKTDYKMLGDDKLVIYIERRCRTYNGEKFFDFTVLYESADNM